MILEEFIFHYRGEIILQDEDNEQIGKFSVNERQLGDIDMGVYVYYGRLINEIIPIGNKVVAVSIFDVLEECK